MGEMEIFHVGTNAKGQRVRETCQTSGSTA